METIYIDRLFILNLIIDYLILLVTAKICGLYLRRPRYLMSAVFGASYAALSVLPFLVFLTLLPMKLGAGIIMSLIAFGNETRFFRTAVSFFGVSALFGGAVWAISLQSGTSLINSAYMPVSLPVLALSFGISYALLSVIFRRRIKNAERKICDVFLTLGDSSLTLRALCDSGNTLYDPVTGSSVMIVCADKLAPLFPGNEQALKLPAADMISDAKLNCRMRLIPYRAVGVASSLLPAFRPDGVTVDGNPRDDILVAVSPTDVGGDGFNCIM